jgi:hypothetical protein
VAREGCRRDYPGSGPVVTYAQYEPVALVITYSLLRPASHYGTGRNAGIVKPSAPQYPTARGTKDMDKLERAIFDALQAGGVVHDDAQIVDCTHRKRYAGTEYPHGDVLAEPGVLIRIYPGGD